MVRRQTDRSATIVSLALLVGTSLLLPQQCCSQRWDWPGPSSRLRPFVPVISAYISAPAANPSLGHSPTQPQGPEKRPIGFAVQSELEEEKEEEAGSFDDEVDGGGDGSNGLLSRDQDGGGGGGGVSGRGKKNKGT